MEITNQEAPTMLEFLASLLLLFILPFCFFFFIKPFFKKKSSSTPAKKLPRSYPFLGSSLSIAPNLERYSQWTTELLQNASDANGNIILDWPFGNRILITTNPANVQHILKTKFSFYIKGDYPRGNLENFLGAGIFNADDDNWKFQRQISSHEFNSKSLRKFIKTVVEDEISDRLLPLLSMVATTEKSVIDLQDILQRFAFDNICKISFGYDPEYLSPSLSQQEPEFAVAFDAATCLSFERFTSVAWKVKRALDIGSEKQLRLAISTIRDFATKIVREKKRELEVKSSLETSDILSRFLSSGHSDEIFVIDMVISFILAGRDTTSAALTWFFWLVSRHSHVEQEMMKEIMKMPEEQLDYDDVKNMIYTHASLCESMRLYPPVPYDTKFATIDDVLPDGSVVKKGMAVQYHTYAMGRMESIWGKDWEEFKPERWLEEEDSTGKWRFVGRDPYTYPVFHAGPRICLGKDMGFLQMKRLVAGVMRRYRVMPADEKRFEPMFTSFLTAKMKGGFPVRIEERRSDGCGL